MSARALIERSILEAVPQELVYLARALSLSDEEKASDAAYHLAYELPEWASDNEVDLGEDADDDPFGALEKLQQEQPKIFQAFAHHALKHLDRSPDAHELPWTTMEFQGYVRHEWLIHFSDDAHQVWSSGFKYGVDPYDRERLALTTHSSDQVRKRGPGFNFAFLASDVYRYAMRAHYGRGPKYGKEAVMFRSSGIKVWHYGDEEPQVIFLGETARDPVYLYQGGKGWAVGERPSSEPIFSSEDLDQVIDWVMLNHDQYRKPLRPQRERPNFKPVPKAAAPRAGAPASNPAVASATPAVRSA